jgi:alpha-1,2-mannosyltransferase
MAVTIVALGVTILAILPFLIPFLWRAIGLVLGWYLKRKTDGRRARILEVVEEDEKTYAEKNKDKKDSDDEDWENIDATAVGSSNNGGKGEKEWDGIVGFFHPFW